MQGADQEKVAAAVAIVRDAIAKVAALEREQAGAPLRALADRLYDERRRRDRHFPEGLFGEPAWDLLLGLFIARATGRDVAFDEACSLAGVDRSEAAALFAPLEEARLVCRAASAGRDLVALTDAGTDRMTDYLARLG